MAGAGLLGGLIMPSRDMLVRAAAPARSGRPHLRHRHQRVQYRRHGRPLMFGLIMDHGMPRWVFGMSVIVMVTVALVALVGDRRSARAKAAAAPAE